MLRVLILASLCFSLGYATCPSDYTELYGYCYRVYTSTKNFAAAESQCVSEGGHLASIHDDSTDNALTARIPKAQMSLLGLQCTSNNGTHGNCAWADGTPYAFDGFNGGMPVIPYGRCVTLSQNDGKWYSTACGAQQNSFICKQPIRNTVLNCGDYTPYGDSCIQVKTQMNDYSSAEANCKGEGGHLLSLHNYNDSITVQSLLSSIVPGVNGVLFGLYNSGSSFVYTDSSAYDFVNFANYFPNDRFGNCVQILVKSDLGSAGQWTNVPCDTRLPYVCVRPKNGQLPTTAVPATYSPFSCPSLQLLNDYGTVYSPGFPLSFPANTKCEYLLAGATGTRISIRFPYFNTDSGSVLSIYDGLSETTPIDTLSGTSTNLTYYSSGNVMKLSFQTSNVPRGIGWQAEFNSFNPIAFTTPRPTTSRPSSNCSDVYGYPLVPLLSPNYPNPYEPECNNNYYIQNLFGGTIKLIFDAIDTVKDVDVLTIYDGGSIEDPVLGMVSGHYGWHNISFKSSGSWMTVNFNVHSKVVRGGGWLAEVRGE